jgi:acyl carrier protein
MRTASAADWEKAGIDFAGISSDDFILDVRPDSAWEGAHIAGATHVNIALSDETQVKGGYVVDDSQLAQDLEAAYNASGSKRIVVICMKGQTLAARTLQYFNDRFFKGFGVDLNKVTYLIGGADNIDGTKVIARTEGAEKARTMITTIDMSKYEKGKVVKVWVPVPQTEDYQTITDVKYEAKTAKEAKITTEEANGNKMLYLEWDADAEPAGRIATLSFNAARVEAGHSELTANTEISDYPEDVKPYITKESQYVKVNDPIVQKYAAAAVSGATGDTDLEKVKAILSAQFDVDEDTITPETNIMEDLGADSLDVVDMLMSLEDEFDVEISDEEIEKLQTVAQVVSYIEENQ